MSDLINSEFGMNFQRLICEKYLLTTSDYTTMQFEAVKNEGYDTDKVQELIEKIFNELKHIPVECTTLTKSTDAKQKFVPYNFVLDDGSTLSIRTCIKGSKVAPRLVGQCGIETFNDYFSGIAGSEITDKNQIKKVVINKIDKMLPIFIDCMFSADYTVYIQFGKDISFSIINSNMAADIEYDLSNFSFTKGLSDWNESTTLKYKEKSIAEIQIHKNRTFKFRFIMDNLIPLLVSQKTTTETFGLTAEVTICKLFNLEYPDNMNPRLDRSLEKKIEPIVKQAFKNLPNAIKYTGTEQGERKQQSKCSYDFVLDGVKTLSLKTNTGKMVCPPEVGQPSAATCYLYFKDFLPSSENQITKENFKQMVYDHIREIFPIYVEHLFDSDYLLWIYETTKKDDVKYEYKIFEKNYANNIKWNGQFTFSKDKLENWNESNTLYYDGTTIGEFQVHKNRDCYKFRFNLLNLEKIVESIKK